MEDGYVHYHDIKVPKLGFGTWQQRGAECREAVKQALSLGYRHIDTAQIYENEGEVGQAIAEGGVPRDQIFLTTKIWRDNVSAPILEASLDDSLRQLRTDHVDLLLLHWPVEEVAIEEQIRALYDVQQKGKARLIGISNYPSMLLHVVADELNAPIATDQVEYHPYLSQETLLRMLRTHGMFLTAYSPLARGKVLSDPVILDIAAAYGKNAAQVTLRWLIQQRGVVAIPKSSGAHIASNAEIFDFELSPDEMQRIHQLARPEGRLIDPEWSPQWDTEEAPFELPERSYGGAALRTAKMLRSPVRL